MVGDWQVVPGEEARCPECGARLVDDLNCFGQLGALLAWEAQDAELAAIHFLTVATYNLQHPASFTPEAWQGLRAALIDHLDNGVPVSAIRRRVGRAAAGSQRVLRPDAARRPTLRGWAQTVADAYAEGNPAGAAARVRRWAAAVRREL